MRIFGGSSQSNSGNAGDVRLNSGISLSDSEAGSVKIASGVSSDDILHGGISVTSSGLLSVSTLPNV